MRVLLVEDELHLRKLVSMNLELESFEVDTAENGEVKLVDRSSQGTEQPELESYTFGPNTINFNTFQASNAKSSFDLKPKELQIMKYLISNKNIVVSRRDLLKNVWGYDVYPSTRTIDNFIATLRKYFEADNKNPSYIKSVRGIGYKFVSED